MSSFNKVIILGNLTRDPSLSFTPNQTAVVDFGMATNRKWTAQDGSQREEICFVDCRAFGKMAENINKFFKKGQPIFVEGRLSFDQWTGQDGVKKSKHRVTVDHFTFLPNGAGKDGQGRPQVAQPGGQPPAGENYDGDAGPAPGGQRNRDADHEAPGGHGEPVPDDLDIPF